MTIEKNASNFQINLMGFSLVVEDFIFHTPFSLLNPEITIIGFFFLCKKTSFINFFTKKNLSYIILKKVIGKILKLV